MTAVRLTPTVIRRGDWLDWQQAERATSWVTTCLDSALEQSTSSWLRQRAAHLDEMAQLRLDAEQSAETIKAEAVSAGHQEGLAAWLEHLMVWTHYRRQRLRSLREDVGLLIAQTMASVIDSVATDTWLQSVLGHLDPLIDGRHPLTIHIRHEDISMAQALVHRWWCSAGWDCAEPQVVGSDALQHGQCRITSVAGVIESDLSALIQALGQCTNPSFPPDHASQPTAVA